MIFGKQVYIAHMKTVFCISVFFCEKTCVFEFYFVTLHVRKLSLKSFIKNIQTHYAKRS
jgi:hypothetical protein